MPVVFDDFVFDPEKHELRSGRTPVHVGPKAFRLLEILIASRPKPIRKQQLYEAIWEQTVVDESNLAGLISELRNALGDRPKQPRYIRTVHGFGYAFCADAKGDAAPPRAGSIVFRGTEWPLHEGKNVLGRDPSADVQIDDHTVSRKHAIIDIGSEAVIIEDLSSKNGTFLDGEQLFGSAPLRERHSIVLGDAAITFRRANARSSTVTMSRMRKR